jgi:hypothetical protein
MENHESGYKQMRQRFVQLSADSSAHGYHNIFKTKILAIRLMWIAFSLTSAAFFGFLLYGSIHDYRKYEVQTTTTIQPETEMKLPMISFCNSKPMMTKFAYDYAIQQFIELYGSPVPENTASVLYGNFSDPRDFFNFNNDNAAWNTMLLMINKFADPKFNQTIQHAFGLDYGQFFNQLTANSRPILHSHSEWYYDPVYGSCWRVNSGQASNGSEIDMLEQTFAGYNRGILSINFLDVFANQSYNFFNTFNINSVGLKIFIEHQDALTLHNVNMLAAKPGTCTYIGLKKIVTKNQHEPYTACKDLTGFQSVLYDKILNSRKTYSQQACLRVCMQKKVTDTCGCSFVYFPNLDRFTTCQTVEQINCFNKVHPTINMTECDEWCPLECESLSYEYSISSDIFPDDTNLLLIKTDEKIADLFRNANVNLANASFATIANSVACVYIYYQDFYTTTIVQTPAMTWVIFLYIFYL